MEYRDLPSPIRKVCEAFVSELKEIFQAKLHGIYMYGAAMFPDPGPIQDIDCHAILASPPDDQQKINILHLYENLKNRFPPLGSELDTYFILYDDARKTVPPVHQLRPEIRDESWALHCAHIRAGRCLTLYGPEPIDIFPAPSWSDISTALDHEIQFISANLKYPDYCTLNLCRIIYSFQEQNVVISKRFSGNWACAQFPQWAPLIKAAIRSYESTKSPEDANNLQTNVKAFLEFATERIRAIRTR